MMMVVNELNNRSWGAWVLNAVKEALFPAKCLLCESFFDRAAVNKKERLENFLKDQSKLSHSKTALFKEVLASYLCPACNDQFRPVESPLCLCCGIMFESRVGHDHYCADCLERPRPFRKARAFGVYNQTLMEAIHCFKYHAKIQLARPFGIFLFSVLLTFWDEDPPDIIAPIPLHAAKLRQRGFNQTFMMIKDWPGVAVMPAAGLPNIVIERELLQRTQWTEPQTGLGRSRRRKNIKGAFDIRDKTQVSHKKILLVDDVYTTGATVEECSTVLLRAGAEWVDVLTLARTL